MPEHKINKDVEAINQRQLSTKKPVIDKEETHYEWEDTSLLPLLCEGIPQIYPRNVAKEDQETEEKAIRLANKLISSENKDPNYQNSKKTSVL